MTHQWENIITLKLNKIMSRKELEAKFMEFPELEKKITNYEIEDVKSSDYPDFCDAFISYAEDENGNEMTEEQIEEWTENNEEEFYDMIQESLR